MNIVVTGGSRGIGAAIVVEAVAQGHDVALTYVQQQDAARRVCVEATAGHPDRRCLAYQLDVRDSDAVESVGDRIVDEMGEIHAIVLNAGINRNALAVSMTDDDWATVLDTNLTGSFYVARYFLNHFLPQRSGRLVFISSIGRDGVTGQASYCASKAGLHGLSAALAKEYGPRGITSNCVVAGFFDTDMTREGMSEKNRAFWLANCPARRLGEVDEVAHAVLFLCSREAGFINGQSLPVTGGLDWAP